MEPSGRSVQSLELRRPAADPARRFATRQFSSRLHDMEGDSQMTTSKTRSTPHDLLSALPDSPDAYPQKLDLVRASVLQIAFDEAAYRAASFLDDRILTPATRGAWMSIDRVAEAARLGQQPRPLHYILHTGHVGSTLLSRLLDTTGTVLSLREPLPLRTLAEASDVLGQPESLLGEGQFATLVDTFVRLWSRGYAATQSVLLKATSATARIAPMLLRRKPDSRAVYLTLRAEPYLATLLAGANSAMDLRGHGPERMRRLCRRLDAMLPALHSLTPGELVAMSWLAESLTRRDVLDQASTQVLPVDFDAFLADVPGVAGTVVGHLQLAAPADWLAQLGANPALTRYSKSPEHEYSPALRAQVLAQARRDHATEIGRGLAWLDSLARRHGAVERVLQADSF
jgi:hypothetical protein